VKEGGSLSHRKICKKGGIGKKKPFRLRATLGHKRLVQLIPLTCLRKRGSLKNQSLTTMEQRGFRKQRQKLMFGESQRCRGGDPGNIIGGGGGESLKG